MSDSVMQYRARRHRRQHCHSIRSNFLSSSTLTTIRFHQKRSNPNIILLANTPNITQAILLPVPWMLCPEDIPDSGTPQATDIPIMFGDFCKQSKLVPSVKFDLVMLQYCQQLCICPGYA